MLKKGIVHFQGCYSLVKNFLIDHGQLLTLCAALVALVQVVGVVLGCCLARTVSKAEMMERETRFEDWDQV